MPRVDVNGVAIQIEGVEPGGPELAQLRATLAQLPVLHLRRIPTITVGERPPRGGGGSAHAGMPGGPYIRLNRMIFDPRERPVNAGAFNYTLLHECGHIMDWAYGCMNAMRTEDREGYRALMQHPHRGATQGPGEHYADGYADYFFTPRIRRRRIARSEQMDPRMRAMQNSRAFRAAWTALLQEIQ